MASMQPGSLVAELTQRCGFCGEGSKRSSSTCARGLCNRRENDRYGQSITPYTEKVFEGGGWCEGNSSGHCKVEHMLDGWVPAIDAR